MKILVIDAQGGGVGKALVESLKKNIPDCEITAIGTNSVAMTAMLKAGADHASTGENAVIVGCRKADVIVGPIGIAIADSLYGEITPKMAVAVGQSCAKKVFIPLNCCDNIVAGVQKLNIGQMVEVAVGEINGI